MEESKDKETTPQAALSRRSFLKGAAAITATTAVIGSGGLAKAAGVSASHTSLLGQPFWIKKRDTYPVELDDSVLTRFDNAKSGFRTAAAHWGPALTAELNAMNRSVNEEGVRNNVPGYDLKSQALGEGADALRNNAKTMYSWTSIGARHPMEAYGVGPWQGPPEEAAAMVKAAGIYYGAGSVGVAELDRRWIYESDGAPIVFEDVDQPAIEMTPPDEEGKTRVARKVIPNKVKYVIAITIPMSFDLMAYAPTPMQSAATGLGYSLMPFVAGSLAEFIRALGYVAIPCGNDTGLSVPMCIDAGLGEISRTGRLTTPEFGMNVRLAKVLTDLPMAVDRPIDFGAMEFCRTCKKCAEFCPGKSLSHETEPFWEVTGPWNQPGKKVWHEHAADCLKGWRQVGTGCAVCVRVCPYTKKAATAMHSAIKATISAAPFLNSTVVGLDNFFGYGEYKDPDKWWKALHESFARDGIF